VDAEFLAEVALFGPAALALPAIALAWHRGLRAAAAERAAFAALRATAVPAAPERPRLAPVRELRSGGRRGPSGRREIPPV
jgi:hypothetical protein